MARKSWLTAFKGAQLSTVAAVGIALAPFGVMVAPAPAHAIVACAADTFCGDGGLSVSSPVDIPSSVGAIDSSAPPDDQYYEFSIASPTSTIDVTFSGSGGSIDGSLDLYLSTDTSSPVATGNISDSSGSLYDGDVIGGDNYILEVDYDASVDPNWVADISPDVNSPVPSGVPEPASLTLFGAALAGLGLRRWRKKSG
jgi:hypothetical protein